MPSQSGGAVHGDLWFITEAPSFDTQDTENSHRYRIHYGSLPHLLPPPPPPPPPPHTHFLDTRDIGNSRRINLQRFCGSNSVRPSNVDSERQRQFTEDLCSSNDSSSFPPSHSHARTHARTHAHTQTCTHARTHPRTHPPTHPPTHTHRRTHTLGTRLRQQRLRTKCTIH